MNWCLLNYSEGQICFINWAATQTITTSFLTTVLIILTAYYAMQTHKQVSAMQDQVVAMQNQTTAMQEQLSFERTFRPRLDAYMRFMEIMSSRSIDVPYQRYTIHGNLKYIQPFASGEVRRIASEIYESTITEGRVNIPSNFVNRINADLIPRIETEIAEITGRTNHANT